MKKILSILIILLLFPVGLNAKEINLYLFHQESCMHCKKEIEFLDKYVSENKEIKLVKYEVSHDEDNFNLFKEAREVLNKSSNGVPYLIIGSSVIIGYNDSYTKDNIISKIKYYESNEYIDVWGKYLSGEESNVEEKNDTEVSLPILGKINAKNVSLSLVTIVLGFVDGFNPCAMWILIFLISMLFTIESKKKRMILGIVFLLTSGIIYLLFMTSWLRLTNVINGIKIIQILIGVVALIFGSVNIIKALKKNTGCEVVNTKKKKTIINSIKSIVSESKFILSIMGIILLAISVNFIELMCSLGLPLLFTQILSLNDLNSLQYFVYMILYIIFYLIDDIIIFMIAMKTLEIKAISNKYGKYSHLIGGIIMLIIGILMIVKPEWLSFSF